MFHNLPRTFFLFDSLAEPLFVPIAKTDFPGNRRAVASADLPDNRPRADNFRLLQNLELGSEVQNKHRPRAPPPTNNVRLAVQKQTFKNLQRSIFHFQ